MTAIAKKNPYRKPYKFKTTHMTINQRMYNWADNLFFNQLISGSILHTLKAIITTRHMKQPTFKQINQARTRSAALKFAQSNAVSEKTIERHIQKLEELKYIKVNRDKKWLKTRNSYWVCVPDEVLVKARTDIMSVSLSCSNTLPGGVCVAIHQDKKQTKKNYNRTAIAANAPGLGRPVLAAAPEKNWRDEELEKYMTKMKEKSNVQG